MAKIRPALLALLLVACAPSTTTTSTTNPRKYVPFTYSLLTQYSLTPDDALKLQFYTSGRILLNRTLSAGSSEIAQGKLITRSGVVIDEVEVVPLTPGVARSVTNESIVVGFGGKSTFTFMADSEEDSYGLAARDWGEDVRCQGRLTYGGLEYIALSPSCNAILVIDKDALQDVKRTKDVLPGEKLP